MLRPDDDGTSTPHDGRVTAAQMCTWRLDADLVTLSACETGIGQPVAGEGHLGFSQALLQAGARSLLLSLWPVDDNATRLLMVRFYENYLGAFDAERAVAGVTYRTGDRLPAADALAEAKSWLRGLTIADVRALEREAGDVRGLRKRPAAAPQTDGHRPYQAPYFWASFVLIGDSG